MPAIETEGAVRAPGGPTGHADWGGSGGSGGAGAQPAGEAAERAEYNTGGGGGAAGRVRVNTQDATLQISDDGTAITDSIAVTAGTTPVEADRDDMLNDQYPHIASGSVLKAVVGHGDECVDFFAVLTFVEG